jgi:two-component system, NtrC family, nitrogen regulation sensor histidine kinase NtrY
VGLVAWARWISPWWLLVPTTSVLVWVILRPTGRLLHGMAAMVLLVGTLVGFVVQRQMVVPMGVEGESWRLREEQVSAALSKRFEVLLDSGDKAAHEALALLESAEAGDLQGGLSRIRRRWGATALAIYDGGGGLQAWVGVHRGQVPQAVRRGEVPYAFGGGPLFRYLYFTARSPEAGGTAVAARLLQANLPAGLEGGGFVSRFRRDTGFPVKILPPERVEGAAVWDLRWAGEPLLSVSLDVSGLRESWVPRLRFWVRMMVLLAMATWILLVAGSKDLPGFRSGASGSLLMVALLLPGGEFWPGTHLASPAQFLLPLPFGGTLGQLLGIGVALGVLWGLFPGKGRPWRSPLLTGLALALAFPALDALLRLGPSPALLSSGAEGWLPYQITLSLLLSLAAGISLGMGGGGEARGGARWQLAGSAALAVSFSLGGALLASHGAGLSPWFLAAWALPGYLAVRGLDGFGRGRRLLCWPVAALMGSTAALPAAWGIQIESRIAVAEGHLRELGAEADPFLEFRLLRVAEVADSLSGIIPSPVEFLFEVWAGTGQQGDPLPMWLTLWSPGDLPREDLAMGVYGNRPPEAGDFLEEARELGAPLVRHLGLADARYLLLVPLRAGWVVSAVVPPRGSLSLSSPLGPIFAMTGRSWMDSPTLVRLPTGQEGGGDEGVRWERTRDGWRGSLPISYPEGWYQGRQTVALPGPTHLIARGTLVLCLNLLVILALWGMGRALARGRELRIRETWGFLGTFRARVTMALFGFFLLSIAIFGTLAFRTLSGAAQRTAAALAERLVEDGAGFYPDVAGSMPLLAKEVGADLLEYRAGELRGGSAEELVELGLYETWIPEPIFRALSDLTEVRATRLSSLGRWDYVMAYRRLSDRDILATPVPLEVGAMALRRQEVTELLGFAIVLGAALSLALAMLVGRTLTRPMETLQVASERVGSGNLRVRLPEGRSDEFGAVFSAFNRMVQRIHRARRALLRTTRRTQAIVEEVAMGLVALDAAGRVTLVNPRAEALLGERIQVGRPLPGREGEARELVRWVDLYFRDGLREANTELQMGNRRIRIRARRVSGEEPLGGAVLSMEDLTDELRTERILAWGEMAQQVAHEVKNPLTPMKLSVQHLQRAWEDRRPDFGDILGRNVDVILKEIDHLAAIARSFSRFRAPGQTDDLPLQPVRVQAVAEEVLNLYRGGKGALTFRCAVPPDLPPVQSRESELREVLINLLENSRAAVPDGGEVVIEAEGFDGKVELRVRDDGVGIPRELLTRIFEPHFSTRSTGTGLGLAIVRRLVQSWGGGVSAESLVGGGTVLRMVIPMWGAGDDPDDEEEPWT